MYLNRMHAQINGEHAFFVFVFSRQVMAVFVVRIVVSVIMSLNKNKGESSVCWLVLKSTRCQKVVSQSMRNIERGIAEQPKIQHLGWPCSVLPKSAGVVL